MTKPRLATLPSSTSTASEPRCSQMPCALGRLATGGEHAILVLAPEVLAARARVAVEQAGHLRREQHLRAARRRLGDRLDQRARIGRRVDPGLRLEERDPGHQAAISASSLPSRSSAIEVVAPADVPLADENLRHGRASVGALDHLLLFRAAEIDRDLLIRRRPWSRAAASPASNRDRRSWCRFRPAARTLLPSPT